jgi:SAM-dependent methyltransferase
LVVISTILHWPTDTDESAEAWQQEGAKTFYAGAYSAEDEYKYQSIAKAAADAADIQGNIEEFVRHYDLAASRVLDIGAGRGSLQDVVSDYVGLDISPTAKSFFHKPFVEGSATAMPFPDSSFDAAWSIWVVEHIPEPEKVFREIRRVIKPGGYVYLMPVWNVPAFNGQGFEVRPYTDFDWSGKLVKATVPVQKSKLMKASYLPPRRILKEVRHSLFGQPTQLTYRRIIPDYSHYWTTDTDAVIQLDRHETSLWFRSRGDECLNCSVSSEFFGGGGEPLILRIRK